MVDLHKKRGDILFDLWMDEGTKIVKEIIEQSNLRKVTKAVLDDYMTTESFKTMIEEKVANEVARCVEEYAEFYMTDDQGFDAIRQKIRQVMIDAGNKTLENK